jgi:prepilin-type N-terminal cleavage/methylation domain-containing protein
LIMRTRGFTLIELMVAIFITAIVFALGYGAINQAVNNKDALKDRQERLLEVQTTMRVIAQDISQLAPRAIRNPSGNSMDPVLESSTGSQPSCSSRAAAGPIRPVCSDPPFSAWPTTSRTRSFGANTGRWPIPCFQQRSRNASCSPV